MLAVRNPTATLLPFWLYILFFKFGAGLHYTLLPALGERILPVWIVGLIIGGASLLQLIFDVPAGFILDRFGYVRVMRLATLVFFFGALALVFDLSLTTYLLSVFLGFIGWLFWGPGTAAYTLASAKSDQGGRFMGLHHTFGSLGIVCAAAATALIIQSGSRTIGLAVAGILLVAMIALAWAKRDQASVHASRHKWQTYHIRRRFIHEIVAALKRLNPASTMLALQNFSGSIFYGIIWFTVPLVIARQENAGILSIGLSIFDLAIVLLGAVLGKLADRRNKKMLVFTGLLIFAGAGLLLGFNLNILFLVLGFLATTGDEMSDASLWSWLEELDKNHSQDGLVTGAITLFEDLGWTVGPILAGFLFTAVGPSLTIAIGAAPLVLTWLFALCFLGWRNMPRLTTAAAQDRPRRHRHKK